MAVPALDRRAALLWLAQVAAVAAAYYASGRIGLSLALPPGYATALWPPSGIALAALLLLGFRVWPGVWIGSFLVNIQDLLDHASAPGASESIAVAAAIATGSTLQAFLAGQLIERFTDYRHLFDSAQDVFKFVAVAAVVYPVGAIVGVTSLCMGGFLAWGAYSENLRTWWLGDLAGVLIFAPLILVWSRRPHWSRREATETCALLALASASSIVCFSGILPESEERYPLAFLLMPFVVWAAFRLGQHAVVLTTVSMAGIATMAASEGVGPFSGVTLNAALLTLQAFVAAVAVTGLALAAAVSERERAAARFRVLVQAAPNAFILVDEDGRILQLNSQTERMFCYDASELIGRQVETLVPERLRGDHTGFRTGFLREPQIRSMGAGRDLFGLRRDGIEFPVEIGLGPIATNEGTLTIASIIDITERKRIEDEATLYAEELARSNADLEQLAYVASHDLQEPLRMVTTYCGLLQERYRGKLDQDADDFIDFAVDGAARMSALVRDLLAYARAGAPRRREHRSVDCNEAMSHVLNSLRQSIKENEATVTFDRLPVVRGDATQMEQLFQNLIGNGIKFHSDRPPQVHLGAERSNGAWLFSVSDNGIGMDPRNSGRIFEVFQRLHRRKDYDGTGIGLSICKRIVERHGGRIWFESEPGEGSTFFFTLPAGKKGDRHERV